MVQADICTNARAGEQSHYSPRGLWSALPLQLFLENMLMQRNVCLHCNLLKLGADVERTFNPMWLHTHPGPISDVTSTYELCCRRLASDVCHVLEPARLLLEIVPPAAQQATPVASAHPEAGDRKGPLDQATSQRVNQRWIMNAARLVLVVAASLLVCKR